MKQQIKINEELFNQTKKELHSFIHKLSDYQFNEVFYKSGIEDADLLKDDIYFIKAFTFNLAVSATIFAFQSSCYAENTPYEEEPTEREIELLNLWTTFVCQMCEINGLDIGKRITHTISEYSNAFKAFKEGNVSIKHYVNKGFFNVVEEKCFPSVAKNYVKKHGKFSFEAISEKVAKKMNYNFIRF